MKKRVIHFIKQKSFRQFVLFSILAFIFLIFSKLSNDYKQNVEIKLELANLSEEVIIKDDSLHQISAYVQAKGFALTPFLFKKSLQVIFDAKTDFIVTDNFFLFDVQKHRFEIENKIGKSFKILSLSPDTLLLPYSKMASKMVPIEVKANLDFAIGYDLKEELSLSSDSVKIVGPSDSIDTITVLKTKELQLSDVRDNIEELMAFEINDYEAIQVYPPNIKVQGEVRRFTEGVLQIPVIITNKPQDLDINFFPKSVTVSFYVDLEQFNSISSSDFIVECSFTDSDGNGNFLIPKITKQPTFVKRTKIKQNRVDYIKL